MLCSKVIALSLQIAFYQQKTVVRREANLKTVSNIQELREVIRKQEELAANIPEADPPSFAINQAVLDLGHHLLDNKPLLLNQYEQCWKEAWRKLDKNPSVSIRSQQSIMIELLKVYGHHVTYSTKSSQRQHGTLLLRKGSGP